MLILITIYIIAIAWCALKAMEVSERFTVPIINDGVDVALLLLFFLLLPVILLMLCVWSLVFKNDE